MSSSAVEIRIIDESNNDVTTLTPSQSEDISNEKKNVALTTKTTSQNKQYGRVIITLDNPVLSDELLRNTPSMADGLDHETEIDLRITGCRLIQISGILLRLPQVAMATGQVLFQRYYYSKSFVRFPMEITAMGCLVLASKVEEAPRRTRDVINVFNNMKQIRLKQPIVPMLLDENYVSIKNQLIKAERRILKELGFCVHVKHPHKFIVTVAQILNNENNTELIQASWSYMNDSLQTDVFLRYSPEAIACACIHLSARVLRVPLPEQPAWYLLFGVEPETIDSICHSILCLYNHSATSQEQLEATVADVRLKLEAAKLEARKALEAASKNFSSNTSNLLHGIENSLDSIDSRTNSPNDQLSSNRTKSQNNNNLNLEQLSIKNRIGNKIKSSITVINSGVVEEDNYQKNDESATTPDTPIKLQKSPVNQPGSRNSSRSPRKDDYRENRHNDNTVVDNGNVDDRIYSDGQRISRRLSPEDDINERSNRNRYKSNGNNSRSYRDDDEYQNGNDNRRSYQDYRSSNRSPSSTSNNYRDELPSVKHRRRSRSPIRPPSDDSYSNSNNRHFYHSSESYRRSRDAVDYDRSRRHRASPTDDYFDDPRPQYNKRSRISPPSQQSTNNRHRSRSPPQAYSSSKYNQHSKYSSSSSSSYRNRTKY